VIVREQTSCVVKTPVKTHTLDHQAKIAQVHQNNNHSQQPAVLPVKRVVFRLGATVMRQARLTQDTEQEEEERLVMDFSEEEQEEVVRRR